MMMNPIAGAKAMSLAEAERLSRGWWVVLVTGILSIIAGILILSINWTLLNLTYFVGAVLILRGILQVFSPSPVGGTRSWNSTIGVISLLVGLAIVIFPSFGAFTLIALALFVGIWLVVSGVATVVGSIANREQVSYWWFSATAGVLAVILGLFALYRPTLTLAVIITVVGIWAIVVGIMEIALSFEIRQLPRIIEKQMQEAEAKIKRAA